MSVFLGEKITLLFPNYTHTLPAVLDWKESIFLRGNSRTWPVVASMGSACLFRPPWLLNDPQSLFEVTKTKNAKIEDFLNYLLFDPFDKRVGHLGRDQKRVSLKLWVPDMVCHLIRSIWLLYYARAYYLFQMVSAQLSPRRINCELVSRPRATKTENRV